MALRRLSLLAGLAYAGMAAADVAVPAPLAVAPNMQLALSSHAEGVQIYSCTQSAWTLKAPEAVLFDGQGNQIGKHYGGPSWELSDGSLITGEVQAKDPGPLDSAIPWLLLKVKTNNGKGMLAPIAAIQRIETAGGLAPKDACKDGDEKRVAYSATYRFFAVKSASN